MRRGRVGPPHPPPPPTMATLAAARAHAVAARCPRRRRPAATAQPRALPPPPAGRGAAVTVSAHAGIWMAPTAPGPGGGVLDRPTVVPGRDSEFDLTPAKKKKKPRNYRCVRAQARAGAGARVHKCIERARE